jgi:hypothetical protein
MNAQTQPDIQDYQQAYLEYQQQAVQYQQQLGFNQKYKSTLCNIW